MCYNIAVKESALPAIPSPMAQPSLPPRGYSIPTHMIFKSQLPPAVFLTWLQLRSLTWCGQDIPPISLQDWLDLTGTSRTTFIRHLNWLQGRHALRWHSPQPGWVSVSFAAAPYPLRASAGHVGSGISQGDCPKMDCPKMDKPPSSPLQVPVSEPGFKPLNQVPGEVGASLTILSPENQDSQNRESTPPSLNPQEDNLITSEIKNLKKTPQHHEQMEAGGERECEGERGLAIFGCPQTFQSSSIQTLEDPVVIYERFAGFTPTLSHCHLLHSRVTDLSLWQRTLEHWYVHRYGSHNLLGMLHLYDLGGPTACPTCH
jgi:hypothetical protein